MEKELAPYAQSLQLRELGFDEPCFGWYSSMEGNPFRLNYCETYLGIENSTKAPTFSQAFRWFRKFHNLHGCVDLHTSTPAHWYFRIDDITTNDYIFHSEDADQRYKTHESAESACLTKLIEIIKNKENEKI